MIITHIKAKNFYSFKECNLKLSDYNGMVYVKGVNKDSGGSNGSGKSCIPEMISFALHGKTIRKSTEESLVNCDSKTGLQVELKAYKSNVGDIVIRRGKRPTFLNFFVNGEDNTQENALKTQEKIDRVLGVNYKTFIASIVFGQHVDLDFLGASADDKRTIIRNFLNLEEMFTLRDNIKTVKANYYQGAKILGNVISEISTQIKDIEGKVSSLPKTVGNVELLESFDQVKKREEKIVALNQQKMALGYELDPIKQDILKIQKEIDKGVFSVKEVCKTCKKTYLKKQTKANINGLKKKLSGLETKSEKLSKSIEKIVKDVKTLSGKMTSSQWVAESAKKEVADKHTQFLESLKALKTRRSDKETEKADNELNYEVMRFWEKAFSESGVIKYFIKNILDYLNFKTNEYLSILTNNQFSIVFNEELDETITNNGRKLSYISLSGGEKRKINLAVMLSLQSLLTHTAKEQSNIIFFDEVAENMDEDGCKGIFNLLKLLKGEDKTIFLITHNADLRKLLDGCKILTIEKKNGESKIK